LAQRQYVIIRLQYMIVVLLIVGLLVLIGGALGLYLAVGAGPRRRRAYSHAQMLLEQGNWREAFHVIEPQRTTTNLSPDWLQRWEKAAGDCQQIATDQAIKEKRYEDALKHAVAAAPLLRLPEADQRSRVVEALLGEVRRQFSESGASSDVRDVLALITRAFLLQPVCPEASFWQALCVIRQGHLEAAQAPLQTAFEQSGKQYIDPALYLGALLHRLGKPQEGLRFLAEANRVDSSCPFITWQMGLSMVAAGGDPALAVRALQRAIGPRGLMMWKDNPQRAWVEAFPDARSYVRRLAKVYAFTCPIFGSDLNIMIRQGQLALAQALYRQGNFQEAADHYTRLLQDSPPTLVLLRGLGLSLAKLKRYDQAYKHLRTAMETEGGADAMTAGYLALCGAMGKPTNPDDKPKNVAWAIRLLARYQQPSNAEWASLYSQVFAEARALKMAVAVEDLVQLCQTLAGVHAVDVQAAGAYFHLAVTSFEAVTPHFAWLYARAASVHGVKGPRDLELFSLAFRNAGQMKAYYAVQKWSIDDAVYAFLDRAAAMAPGRFPEALGTDNDRQLEKFLLERSQTEEAAGRKDSALACMDVLQKLSAGCLAVYDRLACLHYRKGDRVRALQLLDGWSRLAPADHWPLIRKAVIEQEQGNAARRAEAIDRALGLTQGSARAAVAYLGARLELREGAASLKSDAPKPNLSGPLANASNLLTECLKHDPQHVQGLCCLAALRSAVGDRGGLAALAPAMNRPDVADVRFQFLGAVCHLAAREYKTAIELAVRASKETELAPECQFVMAWAHLRLKNSAEARMALQRVAAADKSPSASHAKALLGHMSFARGAYDDAAKWWNGLDPKRRAEWKLDDTLRHTVLLAGLQAYDQKRFEQAAERFREAGRLGLKDRRLGDMLAAALVKAGQRLLFETAK
jgi:tetratricopeptide (TPR) repeat protein